ncbi:MAG: glycosyltransferase [Myxococcota bacterium]
MEAPVPAFVFAKPPVPGVSKTRLAATVGDALAAELAGAFLHDTLGLLRTVPGLEPVLSTPDPTWDFGVAVRRVAQGGGTLGDRIARMLDLGLAERGVALAVGADSPGMPASRLAAVLESLESHDAAFVPSDDGGFVVMGVRRLPAGVLEGVRWSSEHTRADVIAALVREGLSVVCLEGWFDIDEGPDLERFVRSVPRSAAPNTWSVLNRAGLGGSG